MRELRLYGKNGMLKYPRMIVEGIILDRTSEYSPMKGTNECEGGLQKMQH